MGRIDKKRGLESVCHFFLSAPKPSAAKKKVTIQVAARTLGVSKGTIINYLNKGVLKRIKEDGQILIEMDELRSLGDSGKEYPGPPLAALQTEHEELDRLKGELDKVEQIVEVQTNELAQAKLKIKQLARIFHELLSRDNEVHKGPS